MDPSSSARQSRINYTVDEVKPDGFSLLLMFPVEHWKFELMFHVEHIVMAEKAIQSCTDS
jgi:hypothetical protein